MLAAIAARVMEPGAVVAIDGPDCAGKTTLADELAAGWRAGGGQAVRVSIDGFHRPAATRRARGDLSPEGYVDDSFDEDAFRACVLEPLAPGGSRLVVPAVFDWCADAPVPPTPWDVPASAVVVVDGVFLLRRELRDGWTGSVLVLASPEAVVARARERDGVAFGSVEEVERRYRRRYLPGQALYFAREAPHTWATVCVENSDPCHPLVDAGVVAHAVERWLAAHSTPSGDDRGA